MFFFPQSSKVKAGQLWGKSKDDLTNQLEELKVELNQLRVQKIAGGASSKTQRMCVEIPLPVLPKTPSTTHNTTREKK